MGRSLNRAELIARVASEADLSRGKADEVVGAVFTAIEAALRSRQGVRVSGFGTFMTVTRKATSGRHPRTGEKIDIPASASVRFRVGKGLKDAVNSVS